MKKIAILTSVVLKEINAVVIYSSDRFTRDGYDFLTLIRDCHESGVELLCVTEPIEGGQVGELLSYVRGWTSRLEADKIKERTMRGKKALLNQGLLPKGTGKGLYGFQWDSKNKKRTPLEFEFKVAERIFTMRSERSSHSRIAKTLNKEEILTKTGKKWHPTTIRRIITNPAYYGYTYFGKTRRVSKNKIVYQPEENWIYLAEATPAVISRELFQQAQSASKYPMSRPGTALSEYILTGHIICGYCGSPLVGSRLSERYRYYYCLGARATTTRERICKARYVKADMLEELIWNRAREVLENPQLILAELERQLEEKRQEYGDQQILDAEITKLRRETSNYDYQEKRLLTLFRHDEVSENFILDEIVKLKKERETDLGKLADLEQTKAKQLELKETEIRLEKLCTTVHQNLDNCGAKEKRLALDALDVKAVVTKDRVQIQGVIPMDLVTLTQTSGCMFNHDTN
ncbi:recombinase family protein [Candidatus Omnitrophota bacterium]